MEKGLAIVGTVCANRNFVSLFSAERETVLKFSTSNQSLFAFQDENVSMLSYVVKVTLLYYVDKLTQNVSVLSTQHYTQAREASDKYKPVAILDCNKNKSWIDIMYKTKSCFHTQFRPLCTLCSKHGTYKRKTRFTCHIYKDAMCIIHGGETKTYTSNVCLARSPSTTQTVFIF